MQKNNCGRQLVFCPDEKTAIVCHQVQLLSVSRLQPFDERRLTTRVPRWNHKTSIEQMRPFPSGVAFALQFPISTHSPPSQWIVHSECRRYMGQISKNGIWEEICLAIPNTSLARAILVNRTLVTDTRKTRENFTKELSNWKYMLRFPKSNSVEEFALT